MTPRNRETANIDQNRRAAMAGTPIDNDTVPEGEWVTSRAQPGRSACHGAKTT